MMISELVRTTQEFVPTNSEGTKGIDSHEEKIRLSSIPVGLQLHTLRDELSHDFLGTLKKVADIGYQAVEFAGYGDIPAKEMKKALDHNGLSVCASHVGLPLSNREQLTAMLAFHTEYNLEIGSEYLVVPWAPIEHIGTLDQLAPIVDELRFAGELCRSNGIKLVYHNLVYDFNKINGKTIHEHIFEQIEPGLLQAELDLYWAKKAGIDPKSLMCRFQERAPLIHVKDMTADDRGFFTEVGRGIINYPAIIEKAGQVGVKFLVVEQDVCERPPLESVKMSFDYIKSLGDA